MRNDQFLHDCFYLPSPQDPHPRKNGEIGELVKKLMKYLGKKENFEFF